VEAVTPVTDETGGTATASAAVSSDRSRSSTSRGYGNVSSTSTRKTVCLEVIMLTLYPDDGCRFTAG